MQDMTAAAALRMRVPDWVPESACLYLAHTETGASIRALARFTGCHASTVLRQIRRFETRRDDLLVDEALRHLGRHVHIGNSAYPPFKETRMTNAPAFEETALTDDRLNQEALRVLRRLCETGAVLAVAADMDKAVVVRDTASGTSARTAVVDRDVASAMALKDWIACDAPGRVSRYHITRDGRSALNRMIAEDENRASGFSEAQTPFAAQHGEWAEAEIPSGKEGRSRRVRYNLAESPLTLLARRKDRDGQPFLSDALVRAGERLREDFELAQMGARVTQNWDRFLTGGGRDDFAGQAGGEGGGSSAARARVAGALRDLGPGLGDVALRCCCYLEGLERAEKQMGWSARSGKIVLRIALQRLCQHYDGLGDAGGMIG